MQKATGGFHSPLQQLFLLEERARLAGVHLSDVDNREQRLQGVKCIINGIGCVIDMRLVAEVIAEKAVSPIPGTAAWIEGVMNYRGTLVPVYRIHEFLLPGEDANPELAKLDGPLVVLRKERKSGEYFAIRVNGVIGMQKFRESEFGPVEGARPDERYPEFYADRMINSEGSKWHWMNISPLLERMSGTNPRQQ